MARQSFFVKDVKAAPAGGGNPNQIREFKAIIGRIFSVCFNHDGMLGFAGSSLDGKGEVKAFRIDNGNDLWKVAMPETGVYALACSPDGKTLAVSGFDGKVRFLSALSGEISKTFVPVPIEISSQNPLAGKVQAKPDPRAHACCGGVFAEPFHRSITRFFPSVLKVSRALDYGQLILVAKLQGGTQAGVTRMTEWVVREAWVKSRIADCLLPPKTVRER